MGIGKGRVEKTGKVWDGESGKELLTLSAGSNINAYVYSVAFSPDGTRIATGISDQTAKAWEAQSGNELLTLKEHASIANSDASVHVVTGTATGSSEEAGRSREA